MKFIAIQCNTIHSVPLVMSVVWPMRAVSVQLLSSEPVTSSANYVDNDFVHGFADIMIACRRHFFFKNYLLHVVTSVAVLMFSHSTSYFLHVTTRF